MDQTKDKTQLAFQWLQLKWERLIKPEEGDGPGMTSKERFTIFLICYVFAVAMWALVNLGREFELTLNVPIQITNIPDNLAQTNKFLESVEVSVNGEGWMLMNLYNASPKIEIPLNSDEKKPRLNVFEFSRRLISSYPNVNLVKVEPSVINLSFDENVTKKVPVKIKMDLSFRGQYSLLDGSRVYPDSITIQGAESILKDIQFVETELLSLNDIKQNIDVEMDIKKPNEFVSLKRNTVRFRGKVSEFTEGEIRIFIRTENLPKGVDVKYNPAVISIRYDVPIEEYAAAQDLVPYAAFVTFKEVDKDTTGFVTPVIKNLAPNLHLRIRSYQPKRVSYYNVVKEKN